MCGIIGVIGTGEAAPRLLDGLRRLEYRGYDSAGIATLVDGGIVRRRAQGKLVNLAGVLDAEPVGGEVGIGHTRWATHGVPSADNAHPHATERVAVVHNGIIENFQALRDELEPERIGVTVLCPAGIRSRIFDAERNRPAALGGPAPAPVDQWEGMEPREIGRMLLDAVREDRLFVFTETWPRRFIERRHARMMAAFDLLEG